MLGILKITLLAIYAHISGTTGFISYSSPNDISCTDISQHPSWPLLEKQGCGRVRQEVTSRIMSGEDANLAEFPWLAQLIYKRRSNNTFLANCEGSIISEKYILTAAQCCLDDLPFQLAYVTLGDYDMSMNPDCVDDRCAPPTVHVSIEKVIVHNEFDRKNMRNDVCLLRLNEKIVFTDFVSPICLPTSCELMNNRFEGMQLKIAGWGHTGYGDRLLRMKTPVLQKGETVVLSLEECNKSYLVDKKRVYTLGPSQICTRSEPYVGARFCKGDSGGPLMYMDDTTSTSYVVGLISFGKACYPWADLKYPNIPNVYSRVDYYLPWILDNIKD